MHYDTASSNPIQSGRGWIKKDRVLSTYMTFPEKKSELGDSASISGAPVSSDGADIKHKGPI